MIRLRKIEPTDVPFLYQWENDAASWGDSNTHNPLSMYDLRQYVETSTGDIYKDGQLRLIVEDEEETVGCVDLFDFDPHNRKAAIGIYIAPHARGKGVGKQAVLQVEQYAFKFMRMRLLYAIVADTNLPCTAIFRDLQYQAVGKLPSWTLYADATFWLKAHQE